MNYTLNKFCSMNKLLTISLAASLAVGSASAADIVKTSAYRWTGDSIVQGEFVAYAPDDYSIVSTYAAQPHYFMPVGKQWHLKNDISRYPQLRSSNRLHNAIYNMGLDEMVNAVEPDTTLRTGKEWAGVWTRDVSYSIILSMSYLQPEASMISLRHKVNANGRIIQDTGSGGAWPVSSDRMIWAVAAYELYKVTGDRDWLEYIYPVIKNSLDDDMDVTYKNGLVNGETSFIDWREQSYPKWMQTADIYASQAQSTNAVHVAALDVLSKIAAELGHADEAKTYADRARQLNENIQKRFWMADKGYMAMYSYGREFPILNPRSETLGQAFAIIYNQLPADRAASITQNVPVTPFGPAIFYPQIKDMPAYHNNALWPFVASYWTLANAAVGNEQGTLEGFGSVFRPAALFATNKENFVLDNGDIATELNSSNMLWSLSGNLALTHRILFGIRFETDGLHFAPFVPKALAEKRSLEGFTYRDALLNITVNGYGSKIKSFTVNGQQQADAIIPANAKGKLDIVIEMDNNDIAPMAVNHQANAKAPLTPIAWLSNDPSIRVKDAPTNNLLQWNPIEYIAKYIVVRDGKPVAETRQTSYVATVPGEYQVIGVDDSGVQSFASEPRSNRSVIIAQPLRENTTLQSREVSYQPAKSIEGYHGSGFAEVDHTMAPVQFTVNIDQPGQYSAALRYANGNGPVNTENKCAIRTILVDGYTAGTFVMPQRGVANWNDWGMTNEVLLDLKKGRHNVTIVYEPTNENMNLSTNHAIIDELRLSQR